MNKHESSPKTGQASALDPQFALAPSSIVFFDGRECMVQQRLATGQWQLIDTSSREPFFLYDREIAELQKNGSFYLIDRGGAGAGVKPLTPLAVGPQAQEQNLRKLAYVRACRDAFERSRSRSKLVPIIDQCAAERQERAPGFTTVLSWIDEFNRYGEALGSAAFSDRHDLKGKRGSRLPAHLEGPVEEGVDAWLQLGRKVAAYAVVCAAVAQLDRDGALQIDKSQLEPRWVDKNGRLRPPSRSTFERRCKAVNRMVQEWAHKGSGYAARYNRTFQTTAPPDRPYQQVEVDHTTLDLLIVDRSGLILGRPDLAVLRDRATAMVLGYAIGFEGPSYACLMQALRHAYYPKDLSAHPSVKNDWPCYGRIENLIVDNALHFVGGNIQHAAQELGFHITPCPPRSPWLKGAVERFFGSMVSGLVHNLPGTTLENVVARRDHEFLGPATLTLAEFEGLFVRWLCDDYHVDIRRALGPIRGVGAQPLATWHDKVSRYRTPVLPDPELFIALAGDVGFRTIQKNGITWDYITYESPELWALLQHPKHRRRSQGGASQYKVVRDPFDLGQLVVIDPYTNEAIKVPATLGHRAYADGLTLHQHRVILSNARETAGHAIEISDLQETRAQLAELVMKILRHPGRQRIEKRVARYLEVEASRRLQSEVKVSMARRRSHQAS